MKMSQERINAQFEEIMDQVRLVKSLGEDKWKSTRVTLVDPVIEEAINMVALEGYDVIVSDYKGYPILSSVCVSWANMEEEND